MYWKLKVQEYGKIKSAEIEMAPLTLFVGDNNSGKSYLMSLLWGIQNIGVSEMLRSTLEQVTEEADVLKNWLKKQILTTRKHGTCRVSAGEIGKELQTVLNKGLHQNKNNIIKRIFNCSDVKINRLEIELKNLDDVFLTFEGEKGKQTDYINIRSSIARAEYSTDFSNDRLKELDKTLDDFTLCVVISLVTGLNAFELYRNNKIYFPSARTGFILTKDIINKAGRNTAFNIKTEPEEITPFTRPINQFLDVINDLTLDSKGIEAFDGVVKYLESGMTEGILEMNTLPNKEVMYVPAGKKKGMPLRVVSAVVTELSPLILILKHKKSIETLFYEEPEMCLHPQLQQKMARVICQLVNAELQMVITTHSDIILQHINNMIRLSEREDTEELCRQFKYIPADLLHMDQVKVYQLKSGARGKAEVEELKCGQNGFTVPTFNDALDRIMDEGYAIQE